MYNCENRVPHAVVLLFIKQTWGHSLIWSVTFLLGPLLLMAVIVFTSIKHHVMRAYDYLIDGSHDHDGRLHN